MTWASWRKASGDMVPGFRVLIATRVVPFHVPDKWGQVVGIKHRFLRIRKCKSEQQEHLKSFNRRRQNKTVFYDWTNDLVKDIDENESYPSRPLQSSLVQAWGQDGGNLWEFPRHPWLNPESEASARDKCQLECDTVRQRALKWKDSERGQWYSSGHSTKYSWDISLQRKLEEAVFTCGELTAVVIDELLQGAELRARCDVEAAAVQLPNLVVFHIQPFGVVVVQHRQTVGTWKSVTAKYDTAWIWKNVPQWQEIWW